MRAGDKRRGLIEEAPAALDELFELTLRYRSGGDYWRLLRFIARFRFYSPFNALLVGIQRPGATFVATGRRWRTAYLRIVKPEAQPLVILRPMGPVMFVYDVADTVPMTGAPALPPEVDKPFAVHRGVVGSRLEQTMENCLRDGVRVVMTAEGSQSAGRIGKAATPGQLRFPTGPRHEPTYAMVPHRFNIVLNFLHGRESSYSTLVHELAHLYCGHLGTPDPRWWRERTGLSLREAEFEAESVSYLVCRRAGLATSSASYLAGHVRGGEPLPTISLERVVSAAGLIERMGAARLKPRQRRRRS